MMRKVSAIAALAAVAACVGPDFEQPKPPQSSGYTVEPLAKTTASSPIFAGDEQHFVEAMDIPAQWWTLFQSTKLDAMVEQSFKGNPSIDMAKAALRQAHELYSAQWTAYLPTIQSNFSQQRAKYASGAISNPSSSPGLTYSLYTAQLSLSYAPDIFGGTSRAIESAEAQAESLRFQLEAAYLTLSSNVVATAVQEASLREQIKSTARLLEIQHQLTDMVRRQRQIGTAAELDLRLQETAEAQFAATLPPLQKQLAQSRDALAALLGRFPDDPAIESFHFADLTLPRELPVSLPSRLVRQRPDVREAEENLHAATAQVGVALAALFPQFDIEANYGSSALSIGNLFAPYNGFWGFGASLTQTLFDAGALLHRRRAADAAMDGAAAQYRSTVLAAVQNVADTLRALQADADAVKANGTSAEAARAALDIAIKQQKTGSISIVALLTTEIAYQQAELGLIQAQANRFADTAALFQASGGGWWNRAAEPSDERESDPLARAAE